MPKIGTKCLPKKYNNEIETDNLCYQMSDVFSRNDQETTKEGEFSSGDTMEDDISTIFE